MGARRPAERPEHALPRKVRFDGRPRAGGAGVRSYPHRLGPVRAVGGLPRRVQPGPPPTREHRPEAHRLIVGFRASADTGRTVVARKAGPDGRTSADERRGRRRADRPGGPARREVAPIHASMHVLFLPKTLYGADVDAALAKLRADPAVKFADVDQIRHIETVTPNDPLFAPTPQASPPASGQWYLNTPSSTPIVVEGNTTEDLSATERSPWAINNGSPGIVIADVDTGVRFDHPDLLRAGLGGRLLPGYDFVGEDLNPSNGAAEGTYLIANDGDGGTRPVGSGRLDQHERHRQCAVRKRHRREQLVARHAGGGRVRGDHQQRGRYPRHDLGLLGAAGTRPRQGRRL